MSMIVAVLLCLAVRAAVRQRQQGMIRPPSQSLSHLQRRHHPHPCSLQAADVWPKLDTLRFIQPNCSNAPLHILSNIRLPVTENNNAINNTVITNTGPDTLLWTFLLISCVL